MIEAFGALIVGLLGALAAWRIEAARRKAAESRAERAEEYQQTRKAIDESGDVPVPDASQWLRDRAAGKR